MMNNKLFNLEDSRQITTFTCDECNGTLKSYYRFCPHCGTYLPANTDTISIYNNTLLRAAFIFYALYLFICLAVRYTRWFDSYDRLFWIEILFALLTSGFAYVNRHTLKQVLRFNNFKWQVLTGLVAFAVIFSALVNVSVRELNLTLFKTDVNYYDAYKIYIAPTLVMVYSIALMPAIFEELAFRGVLYHYLSGFLDEKLVVFVTAFMFAAMHLNALSLLWLVPFGILLGTLRKKYNTIWYGVIFHFTFNLTSCLIDLYHQGVLWWQ